MANRVILLGHLGNDPELRYTTSGQPVANLRIATREYRQREEHTEWHRIVVFGTTAENCAKYLTKGRQVYVEGRLQTRSWEDGNGVKRYQTEVVANFVEFVGGRGDAPRVPNQRPEPVAQPAPEKGVPDMGPDDFSPPDDDIPF